MLGLDCLLPKIEVTPRASFRKRYDYQHNDFLSYLNDAQQQDRKKEHSMNNWTSTSLRWIEVEEVIGKNETVRRYIPVTSDISVSEDPGFKDSRSIITYMNSLDVSINVMDPLDKIMDRVVGE